VRKLNSGFLPIFGLHSRTTFAQTQIALARIRKQRSVCQHRWVTIASNLCATRGFDDLGFTEIQRLRCERLRNFCRLERADSEADTGTRTRGGPREILRCAQDDEKSLIKVRKTTLVAALLALDSSLTGLPSK
jgi:hypothetical protein